MLTDICERGYAKINLHLDVTGIMDNGFHAVSTVMQSISLYDEIQISELSVLDGEPSFILSCSREGVPCDRSNLALRAALLFCSAAGVSLGGRIYIEKNIPMAAGMAGGSADAAATLRALNRALGEPLSIEELCRVGSALGSDIPFCIVGGTFFADGKGDILHAVPKMPKCHIVAACEGEGVSTPWAYRLLDETFGGFREGAYLPRDIKPLLDALASGRASAVAENMYNIFEEPVLALRPVAAEIRELLLKRGALSSMMSGSGPSVFGIFGDSAMAEGAAAALEEKGYRAYVCMPVAP